MKEVNQCIKTEPGSDVKRQCRHLDAAVMRVITLEGDEVIGEASELTVSKSNVNLGGGEGGAVVGTTSDFTKQVMAYN